MRITTKHATAAALISVLAIVVSFQTRSQAAASPAVVDAAATFKAKCAACHGADGSGNTATGKALKCRDLGSAEVQGQSDAQLLTIVTKGKGKKMPGFEKTLGADTCKALVAYVRSLKK
ncbi:MAG: cytochrome c [Acidobacteriota bacterium]